MQSLMKYIGFQAISRCPSLWQTVNSRPHTRLNTNKNRQCTSQLSAAVICGLIELKIYAQALTG